MLWAKKRKWGWYLTLLRLPRFAVKVLKFDCPLGWQRHTFRKELWLWFWGVKYIGLMEWHNCTRRGYLLEIQWGPTVKEEDIERL